VLEDDVDVLAAGQRADLLAEALPLLGVLVVLVLPELVALALRSITCSAPMRRQISAFSGLLTTQMGCRRR
jgi:hypothetical protein